MFSDPQNPSYWPAYYTMVGGILATVVVTAIFCRLTKWCSEPKLAKIIFRKRYMDNLHGTLSVHSKRILEVAQNGTCVIQLTLITSGRIFGFNTTQTHVIPNGGTFDLGINLLRDRINKIYLIDEKGNEYHRSEDY